MASVCATNNDKSTRVYSNTRTPTCIAVILALVCRIVTRELMCLGETNHSALYNIYQVFKCNIFTFVDCYIVSNNDPKIR
jgi:hypothetical protein